MNGELFLGECKWCAVTGVNLRTLRERSRLIAGEMGGVSQIHYGLFSGADGGDEAVSLAVEGGELLYFGPNALFGWALRGRAVVLVSCAYYSRRSASMGSMAEARRAGR